MTRILAVHSFRGGTGKSNVTANLAALMALEGRRVGVIDTDIHSPGIHVIFGLPEDRVAHALNDYLWGRCRIEDAAHDVTAALGTLPPGHAGRVHLIPSSLRTGEIARVVREGYDVGLLNDGIRSVARALDLDALLVDTHPGVNEETLLSIALADALLLILRPDNQDFQGTAVAVELARRLDVRSLRLLVNKVPPGFDHDALRLRVEQTYQAPVAGLLPLVPEVAQLASGGLFTLRHPDHPIAATLRDVARSLLEA
jgi:MinD-like ATPase involved in chromosome partitioning or flagellar assembly